YNGEIRTMRMFSYRDPRHQRLVIVAKDNGDPALSATVTIKLSTVEHVIKAFSETTEIPLEYDIFSDLNLYLVIGLGSVSFLLLITILVIIVLKCQKPRPKATKPTPPCRNSVVSQRNSTIADSTLVSSDAYWYSLFLAETRKGKVVVRQPIPKGAGYIVSSIPRSTGLTETSESTASTLQEMDIGSVVANLATDLGLDVRSLAGRKALDREQKAVHNLILTAVDGGVPARSGTASIIVRVLDTNDNAPQFDRQCKVTVLVTDLNDNYPEITMKSFKSVIKENAAMGTVIAVISISDRDSGENGHVDLSVNEQIPFALNKSAEGYFALVVSEPLDREKVSEYDITFTVTDRGTPPLSDNETLALQLLDVNDNAPLFPQSFYTIPVIENNAPGSLLSSVTAFDPDLHENQYLVYFIVEKEIANTSMSMLFSINPEDGNLYALKTFDYEREKEFLFHIEARDSGVPPLSSNVTVHIIILDQNDNTPLIVSPWRAHGSVVEEVIPRSTDKGYLIAKVIAIDADSMQNSRITYQFLQITDATLFSLDQYNGEIRTMRMFSYRDPRHQRLVIVAKDNGDPALSATVTIKLSTVEHFIKAFSETTEIPLEYDIFSDLNLYLVIGLGSVSFLLLITILVIIVLKCQKPRPKPTKPTPPCRNSVVSQRNSTIADSTLVSSDAYWYSLFLAETRKGKVVVRQPIPKGAGYIVSSIPRSTGLTETSESTASTLQSATPGERFSLTNAIDPDVGTNSVQTYHLSESEHFTIEIQTGRDGSKFADLILKKALDREQQAVHNLILTAVDGGVPARSGTASIIVRVLDTNDNAPRFDQETYTVNVMENSPIGTPVFKLHASDADEGLNAEVVYFFSIYTSEKAQETFELNSNTGEIKVKGGIDYEENKMYEIHVEAKDKGAVQRSAQCKLTVSVTDMNDNYPAISIKSFKSPVKENVAIDTVIAVISVSDRDSGNNGRIDFSMNQPLPFSLQNTSDGYYALLVSEPLDRENIPEYDITFTVTDRGMPPLSDNKTLTLELLDVNDNAPFFSKSFLTIPLVENNAPGAMIASITATDPDLHENQYLVYFIVEKEIANTSMSMLFSINPEDGNLYALKTFDYEREKEFLFHIEARDSGVPTLSNNVTVHIIILDQNDNTPLIVSPWRAHGSVVEEVIPRSTDKGYLIAKVIAIDADSMQNSRITYQFLQITDTTLFSLDQYNGEIRTTRMFSYRDPRHQRLVIVAKDNGDPALSATVTIKLSTVEHVIKAFSETTEIPLEYDIFSDLNLYLVIGLGSVSFLLLITILVIIVLKCQKPRPKATKPTPPCRNSVVSQRNSTIADSTLVSSDAYWYSLFLAETRKGKVVVRQPIPKGAGYIVSSIPRSTGLTETSESTASTLQSATPGERFSLTNAIDPDVGTNSVQTYHLSESEHFTIEIQTGRDGSKFADLILKKALDREQQAVHNLILTAVDGGVPARSGTASIIVRVLDTNDNAPHFDQETYTVNVMENSPIGTPVFKLHASDADEGLNAEVVYSFSIYTSEKAQETFELNPNTGEIKVKGGIDYEENKIYEIHLEAKDKGAVQRSAQCKLTVSVTDMNDNYPAISIKSFKSPVKENVAIDTVIALISVSDRDSGDNGRVDFSMNQPLPFSLQNTSDGYYALLVSEPLDRENVPEYDITFTVTDRGTPPLSDNKTLTLELLDVNDNAPLFSKSFLTIPLVENNAPGAMIASITATDPDLHENQYLVYFIVEKEIANTSMSMLFSINPEDGNLYALKTFDYEREKEFLFHIEARDSGVPSLSSNVTVHIIILDQNDNTPLIVSPWRAHGSVVEEVIPRSTDKGYLIAKVIAIDADSMQNSRITYQFLQITDATLFSLDQYNGEIRTMRMFSYRDPRHQRLVIVAKDNGDPSLSATVTIKLSTVEHVIKAFSETTEIPLEYDIFSDLNLYLVIGLGSVSFLLLITILVIIVLKCQKPRPKPTKPTPPCRNSVVSQRNSTIADSTLVSSDAYWYSLFLAETRKGKVVVRQPIPKGAGYIVSSIPRSTGLTETSESTASTLQSATPGERFSLTNAIDPDVGTNSVQTYHLSESEHFTIEIQTGRDGSKFADLILKEALDREQQAVHNLILTAVDGGVPARSGTAKIIVRVLDTNDNAPRFDQETYAVNVMENSPIGTPVFRLHASDADEGLNAEVVYSFSIYTSEKAQETFELNPNTGEIKVKGGIDYEETKIYEIHVEAKDKGAVQRSAQCKLTVSVTDMNDNYPAISIKSFKSPVKENVAIDTVIAVISVSDRDSGDNGKVDFSMNQPLPFSLQNTSDGYYALLVSEPLDRENVPEYDITFTVTDRGTPPLSDNKTLTLELLDVNDNAPLFSKSFLTIPLVENNAPGAMIASITATDPDLHENQYLVYFIVEKEIANTSMSMLFSINPEDGNLYALKTFDYEREKEFLFHIEARDSGVPPLSSNVTVHIIILDQNDNTPLIVSPWRAHGSVVEEVIPRSTDKGYLIAKVIAIDADSMQNSRITYQFLQITDATLFSLDQYNGEIRTMRMFSYRDPRHQRLVIVAKDNGDPALSATVTIKLSTVEHVIKAFSETTEIPLEYDIFSDLNLYLVIGLGSVSFLLLITILVIIVLKCQKPRPKPTKPTPPCRNSVVSQRNSTIADSTLVSSDAYWYSLFLAETRKGKVVVRQPIPKGAGYIVSSIPRSTGLTETSESTASTLQWVTVTRCAVFQWVSMVRCTPLNALHDLRCYEEAPFHFHSSELS
ncbi:hypothetical protein JZ751_028762, partial [Albula glossodonta]